MNHNRRKMRGFKQPVGTGFERGTVIQANDRQYVVTGDGNWRVLNYDARPMRAEKIVDELIEETLGTDTI